MKQQEHYRQLLLNLSGRIETLEYRAAESIKQLWTYSRDWLVETGEASEEEARRVSGFLKRDLKEALTYLSRSGQGLSQWLGIDWQGAELELLHELEQLADKTQLEWLEWQDDWAHEGSYKTGELVLGGTLECCQCGNLIKLPKLTEVPACSQCQATEFIRIGHKTNADIDLENRL